MKTIDRHLFIELIKFTLLALISVVTIYLLIDLFEELGYFVSRNTPLSVIFKYYFYALPSAAVLLYPVSLILAVFVVYGQMTRNNELAAFKSAGVSIYRLFLPALAIGIFTIFAFIAGNEFITIRFNRKLSQLRRFVIEKRVQPPAHYQHDIYRIDGNIVLWSRELEKPATGLSNAVLRNFTLVKLDRNRRVRVRVDGDSAVNQDGVWKGYGMRVREFDSTGKQKFTQQAQLELKLLTPNLFEFGALGQPVEEMTVFDLNNYIQLMRASGENVAREEVEFHYRFSYALIGLIVVMLGLPFSVRLRRGGVMLGLGFGLFFSFLYWGVIQTCRAFGASHVISPVFAAWLPNVVFGAVALVLILKVET